jgi:hypothetical protein
VAELDDVAQFIIAEIIGPQPGIKARQPKIHRIRSIRDGRAQAVPIARRRKKFR